MPVPLVKLNAIQVLALAAFGVALGVWLRGRIRLLDRLNIPAPVVGGLIYAGLATAMRDRLLNFEMDLVLRDILMVAFFTSVGMSASLRMVRKGGARLIQFFVLATLSALMQNALGIALALAFGLSPLIGLISGSVAMTGGPATALAFGGTFENLGVAGAATLGIAAATFGTTSGGLLGGHVGGWLIRRHHLKAPPPEPAQTAASRQPAPHQSEEHAPLFASAVAVAVAMGLGTLLSAWFDSLSLVLPAYVGAMIAAGVLRNLDDRFGLLKISQQHLEMIGNISLCLFIVMALLTLQLWELARLALPLIVMLTAQVILVVALCLAVSFPVMGRDYESAVMAGGFCGFMLGTTASALACMDVLVKKYGPAPHAFIVVPLVGAFLIDFTNAMIITALANLFR